MRIISGDIIEKAVPISAWVDHMEKAILSANKDGYFTPDRMHVDVQENTLLLMPSVSPEGFATKLVSVFPKNTEKSQAVIQGTVILNDGETGEAIALLNGSKLTAMRTAAIACLGIRYLSNQNTESLGLIGAGFQGRHMAWLASGERNIKKVYICDFSKENCDGFISFLNARKPEIEVTICMNAKELLSKTSLVLTATSSPQAVLPNEPKLLKGKCFIGVGSFKPNMREFPKALFTLVENIWIDAEHGKQESGDLIDPINNAWLNSSQIKLISDLINQPKQVSETSLYKTVGLGIFDLFAAQLVYENCKLADLGEDVEL